MTCQEGGITVRTLSRLVGMGLCLLGAAPLLWAQADGVEPGHGVPAVSRRRRGGGAGTGGTGLSHAGRPACRLPGQAAARVHVRQAEERHHGPADRVLEEAADLRHRRPFRRPDPGAGRVSESRVGGPGQGAVPRRATAPPACRRASAVTCPMAWAMSAIPAWPASVRRTSCSS